MREKERDIIRYKGRDNIREKDYYTEERKDCMRRKRDVEREREMEMERRCIAVFICRSCRE